MQLKKSYDIYLARGAGIIVRGDKALPGRSFSLNQSYLGIINTRAYIEKCLFATPWLK